jgi:hypothetical protein
MKAKTGTREGLAREVSPRQRGVFIKNLADFQTELARTHAGFVPGLAVWRHRKEFPALIFRALRRVQDLRGRGRELGISFQEMHLSAGVAGRPLLDALCSAPHPADFLRNGVVAVHRVLVGAIEDYLHNGDTLYDLPSVGLLEAERDELVAQMKWAETALAELATPAPDLQFATHIEELCQALPTLVREPAPRAGSPSRTSRQIGVLPFAVAALPHGFRDLEFGLDPLPAVTSYVERERFHAMNFLQEVQAADTCASLLFETPDLPWEFYFDLSRHLWDESRHAMFGERKLESIGLTAAAVGLSSNAYAMRQTLAPLDRYAVLSTQEADAFPGKHAGLKDALEHGDRMSAMTWSYDIADETQHVRYGAKWIPVMIEKIGDPRSVEQVRADAHNWRATVLASAYKLTAASMKTRSDAPVSLPK